MTYNSLPPPYPGARIGIQRAHKTKKGAQQYRLNYRAEDGTRVRPVIGTKREAENAAAPLQKQAYEAKAFGWAPGRRTSLTLGKLSEMHLGRKRELAAVRVYACVWRRILEWFGEDRVVRTITPSQVQEYIVWLRSLPANWRHGDDALRENARATGVDPWGDRKRIGGPAANKHLAVLHSAFDMAIEDKALDENPVRRSLFAPKVERHRVPRGNELPRMLAALSPAVRLAALIASETCLRESNIAALDWERVNLERRTIYVAKTKSGTSVLAPMASFTHRSLVAWRAERPTDDPRVFPSNVDGAHICNAWRRTKKALGIHGLNFHDLRRYAATRMLAANVPLDVVMRIGGWKNPDILLKIYASLDDTRVQDALAKIEAYFAQSAER